MDRRHALLALSGAVTVPALVALRRPAFAQNTTVVVPTQPTTSATLSESQYKAMTLLAGTYAKQSSDLAISQAAHPKVKEFAQFESNEQLTIAQVLTDENNPPPVPLDDQHRQLLEQLQASGSGKAFDVAYVRGQIVGHTELLNIQQGFLNAVPVDRDYKHIAIMARTVIQMHLTMLQDLENALAAA